MPFRWNAHFLPIVDHHSNKNYQSALKTEWNLDAYASAIFKADRRLLNIISKCRYLSPCSIMISTYSATITQASSCELRSSNYRASLSVEVAGGRCGSSMLHDIRPEHVLSVGENHRAPIQLGRRLHAVLDGQAGAVVLGQVRAQVDNVPMVLVQV